MGATHQGYLWYLHFLSYHFLSYTRPVYEFSSRQHLSYRHVVFSLPNTQNRKAWLVKLFYKISLHNRNSRIILSHNNHEALLHFNQPPAILFITSSFICLSLWTNDPRQKWIFLGTLSCLRTINIRSNEINDLFTVYMLVLSKSFILLWANIWSMLICKTAYLHKVHINKVYPEKNINKCGSVQGAI